MNFSHQPAAGASGDFGTPDHIGPGAAKVEGICGGVYKWGWGVAQDIKLGLKIKHYCIFSGHLLPYRSGKTNEPGQKHRMMEKSQIRLLNELAKEVKKQKRDKTQIMETLTSAKILTKDAKFTKPYSNHKKIISE